jgi:uncharacterized membrane protein (GlpM family)
MIGELAVRFLLGGLVVCVFAAIGDALKPKSLAGIFGAAPSVALVTLALVFAKEDGAYAALEGRSMVAGAVALLAYSLVVSRVLLRRTGQSPINALVMGSLAWIVWLVVAFSLWGLFLR